MRRAGAHVEVGQAHGLGPVDDVEGRVAAVATHRVVEPHALADRERALGGGDRRARGLGGAGDVPPASPAGRAAAWGAGRRGGRGQPVAGVAAKAPGRHQRRPGSGPPEVPEGQRGQQSDAQMRTHARAGPAASARWRVPGRRRSTACPPPVLPPGLGASASRRPRCEVALDPIAPLWWCPCSSSAADGPHGVSVRRADRRSYPQYEHTNNRYGTPGRFSSFLPR